MTKNVFTAFSGYDSQMMALRQLSKDTDLKFELVGWSEIEPTAIVAHNAAFPEYSDCNYGDISKINWTEVPDFDVFTYSFPCQAVSRSGKSEGIRKGSGTTSSLLWECERAIRIKRPQYCIMENVKALVTNQQTRSTPKELKELIRYVEAYVRKQTTHSTPTRLEEFRNKVNSLVTKLETCSTSTELEELIKNIKVQVTKLDMRSTPKELDEFRENVMTLVHQQETAARKSTMLEDFKLWEVTMCSLGYWNYLKVLDAADYGVPQHRERTIMVSIRKDNGSDPHYEFPVVQNLNPTTIDSILDDDVSHKNYLPDDKVRSFIAILASGDMETLPIKMPIIKKGDNKE